MHGRIRGRWLFASALLLILTLALISSTSRMKSPGSPLEHFVLRLLAPVQRLTGRIVSPIVTASQEALRLRVLREENIMMREKVLMVPGLETELNETKLEIERLRSLLAFADTLDDEFVAARVVGRNPDDWFGTIVIDKGTHDGIKVDDVVLNAAGLVGRIVRTDTNLAVVMLLTDPDSGVGCLCQRTRDAGVVVGQIGSEWLRMRVFSRDADVKKDDTIVTSGLGSMYPKGLPVGRVVSVSQSDYGLAQTAELIPFVDFDRLEEVLVVRFTDSVLEPNDE